MVDWIYYQVQYATPWVPGTHKAMRATGRQSAVRGVSNAGTPGLVRASLAGAAVGGSPRPFLIWQAWTALLKMFIMRLTRPQAAAA